MSATFFVDENDLALGKQLAQVHQNVVYPGSPDLPEVPRGTLDDEWLAVIGRRDLVVITRDKRIRYRPVEKQMWITHRVRGFVLTGRASQSTSDSMTVLSRHWQHIELLAEQRPSGPWMFSLTHDALREVNLS